MSVKIGSARIDENGKAHGGAAGDQTGKEVSTQSWYAHTKGWVLLRAKSAEARERIARCMQAACDNKHVGYDQYQRDTLYNDAKQYGFDVSKVTKDVETDCSALVRVCVNYAGISVGSFRTTNQASVLMATGAFEKFTDDTHTKKSTNLLRGDILVTKTQGHTVVVLSDGSNAAKERAGNPGTYATRPGVIAKGAEGADVTALQKALAALGYDLGRMESTAISERIPMPPCANSRRRRAWIRPASMTKRPARRSWPRLIRRALPIPAPIPRRRIPASRSK